MTPPCPTQSSIPLSLQVRLADIEERIDKMCQDMGQFQASTTNSLAVKSHELLKVNEYTTNLFNKICACELGMGQFQASTNRSLSDTSLRLAFVDESYGKSIDEFQAFTGRMEHHFSAGGLFYEMSVLRDTSLNPTWIHRTEQTRADLDEFWPEWEAMQASTNKMKEDILLNTARAAVLIGEVRENKRATNEVIENVNNNVLELLAEEAFTKHCTKLKELVAKSQGQIANLFTRLDQAERQLVTHDIAGVESRLTTDLQDGLQMLLDHMHLEPPCLEPGW